MRCPYCASPVNLENSLKVYQQYYGMLWVCSQYPVCDAYVGCHKGTTKPLGRLADKELRKWKGYAHAAFDPLWKKKLEIMRRKSKKYPKHQARNAGYVWLAESLKIHIDDCHIGMFDIDTCKRVVALCSPFLKKSI